MGVTSRVFAPILRVEGRAATPSGFKENCRIIYLIFVMTSSYYCISQYIPERFAEMITD
jgi:hypothetical protein